MMEVKNCSRCGESKPLDEFYFVSKKLGTRRGQCRACMSDLKAMQKSKDWRPSCSRCGAEMERFGPGRRLCRSCFDETYDIEDPRASGSHRAKLNPCSCCGEKRLRADHVRGSSLCPICRSVSQSRRKRLRLYNMTPREFLDLLEDQQHCCWVCERRFTAQLPPHIDHRHAEPMIIRGLLCGTCNTILGLAKDDSERLRGAAKFLEAPPAQYVLPGKVASPEANRKGEYRPLKRSWGGVK
jgi:hypothetical protein